MSVSTRERHVQERTSNRPAVGATAARRGAFLAVVISLGACAADGRPPLSVYHARSLPEIREHMRELASEVRVLHELTLPAMSGDAVRRQRVLDSLERIDARARLVGGDGAVTNHAAVNEYMDGFLEDVALAREFASREPANLVPAHRLVGSCLACHGSL